MPNLDSPGRTIVCFGDSLTAGVGRGDGATYPEHLARRLGTEVINAGVPGDTASQALRRIDGVLADDPWLVVVELGGNDILRRMPLETTESALDAIVERLLDAGVVPLLVEVRGPFGGRYGKLFDRLESRHGVPVIRDVLPRLLLDRRYKSDAIHLNAAGYERLAEEVAQRVEPPCAAGRRHEELAGGDRPPAVARQPGPGRGPLRRPRSRRPDGRGRRRRRAAPDRLEQAGALCPRPRRHRRALRRGRRPHHPAAPTWRCPW